MEYFADLHIHSCLSACGDEDMTPANICGMAKLKGLDAIAICDHNSARNLPAAQELCDAYGLLLLPGMEITTREEVHLLGYFETVEAALAFGEMLRGHLPNKKNKPQFFGRQLVMNSDDEIIGEEEALLIGATDLPLAEAAAQGKPLTQETVEAFANAILSDINPRDSWRASKAFRQHIALEIAKRCLVKSIELAGGELA